MSISDYLSIVALTISSLALFLSWRQYWRDQSHLKIALSIQNDNFKGPLYVIQAVNKGRRPVTIVHANACVSSGKKYPVFDTRTTLNETENLQFTVNFSDFFKSISSGYYIQAFEFEDTTGRRYSIKTNRLLQQVADILREQPM